MPKQKASEILLIAGAFLALIGSVCFVGNAVLWIFGGVPLGLMVVWIPMLIISGALMTLSESK